jgi:hypothetical protein
MLHLQPELRIEEFFPCDKQGGHQRLGDDFSIVNVAPQQFRHHFKFCHS